jgi:WD40 repeat protein
MVFRMKKIGDTDVIFSATDLNQLKTFNTNDAKYVNHSRAYVKNVGEYVLRKESTLVADGTQIVEPTTGSGRWIKVGEVNENNTINKILSIEKVTNEITATVAAAGSGSSNSAAGFRMQNPPVPVHSISREVIYTTGGKRIILIGGNIGNIEAYQLNNNGAVPTRLYTITSQTVGQHTYSKATNELYVCNGVGTVRVYNADTGAFIQEIVTAATVAFYQIDYSHASQKVFFLSGGNNGGGANNIGVYHVNVNTKAVGYLEPSTETMSGLTVLPTNDRLVMTSTVGTTYVYKCSDLTFLHKRLWESKKWNIIVSHSKACIQPTSGKVMIRVNWDDFRLMNESDFESVATMDYSTKPLIHVYATSWQYGTSAVFNGTDIIARSPYDEKHVMRLDANTGQLKETLITAFTGSVPNNDRHFGYDHTTKEVFMVCTQGYVAIVKK